MDVMPPERTGLGLLIGKSLLGLNTSGSGFLPEVAVLDRCSNRSTSDVVGAIDVVSVGFSTGAISRLSLYRLGLGPTAGLRGGRTPCCCCAGSIATLGFARAAAITAPLRACEGDRSGCLPPVVFLAIDLSAIRLPPLPTDVPPGTLSGARETGRARLGLLFSADVAARTAPLPLPAPASMLPTAFGFGCAREFGGCRPKASAAPWRAALLWYCDCCDREEFVVSTLATELALDNDGWFAGMSACGRRQPWSEVSNKSLELTRVCVLTPQTRFSLAQFHATP